MQTSDMANQNDLCTIALVHKDINSYSASHDN